MAVVKLTKTFIDELPFHDDGTQAFYHDATLPGFFLKVGKRTKTFFAQGTVKGRTVRYTIGRYGVYTLDEARREAREKLLMMSKGVHPGKAEKAEAENDFTA